MSYWGVDSWHMADEEFGPRGRRSTLFEIVKAWAGGQNPRFWGRYIGRKGPDIPTVPESGYRAGPPLTRREADYIFSASAGQCSILVIYNGVTGGMVRGNRAAGMAHALRAAAWARGINVPGRVRIYLNIEGGWRPNPEFIRGWWEGMKQSPYQSMGGIYANPDHPNLYEPYNEALLGLHTAERYGHTRYLWANNRESGANCSCRPGGRRPIPAFEGHRMGQVRGRDGVMRATPVNDPVVIWQYGFNCDCGRLADLVDLNVANDQGYRDMWAMPNIAPAVLHAAHAHRTVGPTPMTMDVIGY